jgi:hypothetical protein
MTNREVDYLHKYSIRNGGCVVPGERGIESRYNHPIRISIYNTEEFSTSNWSLGVTNSI